MPPYSQSVLYLKTSDSGYETLTIMFSLVSVSNLETNSEREQFVTHYHRNEIVSGGGGGHDEKIF